MGTEEHNVHPGFFVAQNVPNPADDVTSVLVNLERPARLSLEIYSSIGEKLMEQQKGQAGSGSWQFRIDVSGLKPGIYFYTVKAGNQQITRKMIKNKPGFLKANL